MAKVKLELGAELDVLDKHEFERGLESQWQAQQRAAAAGIKYRRLPLMTGAAAAGVLNVSEATGNDCGPNEGYSWMIKRLAVQGLTAGVTPDVVNLFRNSPSQPGNFIWQFNGNNLAYTFGTFEIVLLPGEKLVLQSLGTFAATGQITLSGELVQVPAEFLWKMA